MTREDFERIKSGNEAAVFPDRTIQKLCAEVEALRDQRDAAVARFRQCKSAVCRECGGSGEYGLADGEVPCPTCGGSGDPTKTGPFPVVKG